MPKASKSAGKGVAKAKARHRGAGAHESARRDEAFEDELRDERVRAMTDDEAIAQLAELGTFFARRARAAGEEWEGFERGLDEAAIVLRGLSDALVERKAGALSKMAKVAHADSRRDLPLLKSKQAAYDWLKTSALRELRADSGVVSRNERVAALADRLADSLQFCIAHCAPLIGVAPLARWSVDQDAVYAETHRIERAILAVLENIPPPEMASDPTAKAVVRAAARELRADAREVHDAFDSKRKKKPKTDS